MISVSIYESEYAMQVCWTQDRYHWLKETISNRDWHWSVYSDMEGRRILRFRFAEDKVAFQLRFGV